MIEFQKLLRCAIELFEPLYNLIHVYALGISRRDAAPEIPEDQFEPWVQVQSKHNTPIEGFWLWLREGEGHNVRDVILSGAATFNSNDPLHVCVVLMLRAQGLGKTVQVISFFAHLKERGRNGPHLIVVP